MWGALLVAGAAYAEGGAGDIPVTLDGVSASAYAGNASPVLETITPDEVTARAAERGFVVAGRTATRNRFHLSGEVRSTRCLSTVVPSVCETVVRWQVSDLTRHVVVYQVDTEALATSTSGFAAAIRLGVLLNLDDLLSRPLYASTLSAANARPVGSQPVDAASLDVAKCSDRPSALPSGVEKAMGALVEVQRGDFIGMGSVISPDGFILTAAHVIGDGKTPVSVRFGTGPTLPATVLRIEPKVDVALLWAKGERFGCLTVAPSKAHIGENAWVLGASRGDEAFSVMRGVISATRDMAGTTILQTDASVNPGDSGGPLLGDDGLIRGVVVFKVASTEFEGLGYAVSVQDALRGLDMRFADRSTADPVGASTDWRHEAVSEVTDTSTPSGFDAYMAAHLPPPKGKRK